MPGMPRNCQTLLLLGTALLLGCEGQSSRPGSDAGNTGGDGGDGGGGDGGGLRQLATVGAVNLANNYYHLALANTPGSRALTFHQGSSNTDSAAQLPLACDFDGDGLDSIGSYDTRLGEFHLRNQNSEGPPDLAFRFAPASGMGLCGDFDGDGIDTVAVYDWTTARLHIRNSNTAGPADVTVDFGTPITVAAGSKVVPLVGDFDGNGIDTLALYDLVTNELELRNSNTSGPSDVRFMFGSANSLPLVGDYDGDGIDTLGVFDSSTGSFQLRNSHAPGVADQVTLIPLADEDFAKTWFPVVGRWQDSGARAELDGFEWPTSTAARERVDEIKLENAYRRAAELPYLHSLLVIRHGQLVREQYFHGFHRGMSNNVASVTKSMLSALYGIAYKMGSLTDTSRPVAEILPSYFPPGTEPAKLRIQIKHLLTMTAGLTWSEVYPLNDWNRAPDKVGFVLEKPMAAEPGTTFNYNTGLTHVAAATLNALTGMEAADLAREHFFKPLGISLKRWDRDIQGRSIGGSAMFMLPRDMARVGQLYLKRGELDGQRILPADWVDGTTAAQVQDNATTWYGGMWWVFTFGQHKVFAAMGYGGQFIFVVPTLETVVVTTSQWVLSEPNGSTTSYESARLLIMNLVLPAIVP